ncbi:MAG: Dihydrolipoyl [Planctomycetota bacterium]|nr:MAG: Dihydrolipoyl [Planctomycetota bacterium]
MRHIPDVVPADALNLELRENVHPPKRENPKPAPSYNLVVLGAGTAGLVTAAGGAGLGAKVALVEKHFLGGDCLNVGCVPSKAVIRASRVVGELRRAAQFGVNVKSFEVDFGKAMEHMRRVRTKISHHDSVERFSKLGVDIFLGEPRFTGPNTVEVDGQTLKFSKAVIATGARAVKPPIPGLAEAGFLTNENVFNLTERPRRLAVIGAGPIGCELAQAFQRLGCEVSLLDMAPHILVREDADAAEVVQRNFVAEGINLVLKASLKLVEKRASGKRIVYAVDGKESELEVDEILVGAGRAPNVEDLGLEKVGVEVDKNGVKVNDRLQTTNSSIYAAGDVCMLHKFTHAADFAARAVLQNALFKGRKKLSALTIPWCTYTDPEVAHVGMYEKDAKEKGLEVDTYLRKFDDVDRAIADREEEGFVKIHCRKGTGEIVGATIVASHAGDMISEVTLALTQKIALGSLANVIHPYPTQAEAIRQCGDMFNRTRLTPFVKKAFDKWLRWTR